MLAFLNTLAEEAKAKAFEEKSATIRAEHVRAVSKVGGNTPLMALGPEWRSHSVFFSAAHAKFMCPLYYHIVLHLILIGHTVLVEVLFLVMTNDFVMFFLVESAQKSKRMKLAASSSLNM